MCANDNVIHALKYEKVLNIFTVTKYMQSIHCSTRKTVMASYRSTLQWQRHRRSFHHAASTREDQLAECAPGRSERPGRFCRP